MITPEQIITLANSIGKSPIIACIGSTKTLSDCFGPIVGQLLVDKYKVNATVVGTLLTPLHAVNLIPRISETIKSYPLSKIIAVDSYESKENKDNIRILNGGIKPGLASGKNLPRIGDFSIISSTFKQNGNVCCLGRIYSLADKVAKLINFIVSYGYSKSDSVSQTSTDTIRLLTL
jgi:putative sporulation protein YyaC